MGLSLLYNIIRPYLKGVIMLKIMSAVLDRVSPMVFDAESISVQDIEKRSVSGLSRMDPNRPSHRAYAQALQEKLEFALAQTREATHPVLYGELSRENMRLSPYTLSLILERDEVLRFLQH